ncbi:Transcription factor IIIB Bdp1 subunit [Penicillium cf. griseofulvum]|uniref:Transcription factor IIIB Bdp1 subunit n=1 Tax=Penicillium cf. griseofulvum TaxID=2972120 RepID=A0A9W9MQ72_9EURO|nr:Transcription factor IIIB Bdp1 subunit [Penicillium cf. griseofulvum]KAJ5437334.1 Transcription factor IIIB Bdp1 subunit [Penicillium cf. griseofulvum]KAJ5441481.1 Transcription factor IIIB Bdp1 subunit [Penicillium cf. griseofulvum]
MKSFSSSAINKTGKKFAPKAPIRRAPAAPARRPSVAQQSPAEPVQEDKAKDVTDTHRAPSLAAEPVPRAVTEASPASVAAPTTEQTPIALAAPPVATPVTAVTPAITTQTVTPTATPIAKPTAIPKPAAISKPTPIPKPAAIPRPQKRNAPTSISQPTPVLTAPPTPPSTQPTPSPANVSTSEAQPPPSEEHGPEKALLEYARIETARAAEHLVDSTEALPQSQPEIEETAPSEGRPTKRARTSSNTSIAAPARKKSVSAVVSRRGSQSIVPTIEDASATPGESNVSTPDLTKPKKRKYSKAGTSDPEGSEKPKRTRKKREPTPEGAETVEILPNVVKMSELCKDLRTGKKSKRETELRKIDKAEEERKKQGGTPGPGTPVKETEAEQEKTEQPVDWKPQSGPIMRIVNGEIVLDNTSLQVDRHADAARAAGDLEDVVESSFTRKINQASYGKRTKTETWDEEMTDLFYRGLRMFGTDFMVISKMFPGRSRRQIKLKFNNEERRDPQRIKDTLMGPSETIDIATYSEMTNTVYDDPKIVQQELDDEKKRIEAQHAKEKELQEDMLRNPTSDSKDTKNDKTVVKKSRKKVGLKNQGGGTEEVLGSIDDFPTA